MPQANDIIHLIPDETLGEFYYNTMKKTLSDQIKPGYLSVVSTLKQNDKETNTDTASDYYSIHNIVKRSQKSTELLDHTIHFLEDHKFNRIKDSQIKKAIEENEFSVDIFNMFEKFASECKSNFSHLLSEEQIKKLDKIIDICNSWNKIPLTLFTEEGWKEAPIHDCINCFTGDTLKEINDKLEDLCEEMF